VAHSAETIVFRAKIGQGDRGLVNRVTAADAQWSQLNVEVRRLGRGERWLWQTGEHEAIFVMLGGSCSATSSRGDFGSIGRRPNVFGGMPWALYLPRGTEVALVARSDLAEIALAWAPAREDHVPKLVTPDDVRIEIRGGGGNSRQINGIVPPGFDCERLVCVEVYTPGGNWSSYPPHKHDVHRVANGRGLVEADLEEVYVYKMAQKAGHAVQRVYTDDRSLDAAVVAYDGDVVLVPSGYHPVSAAFGYDCYYLNFLAGSAQSLACTDDPAHAWIKETWGAADPRVPMVTHAMERDRR
jgi:5-deoxy-glucuronate isomerase